MSKVSNEASEFRKPTMKEIHEQIAKLESKGVINSSYTEKTKMKIAEETLIKEFKK